MLGTIAKKVFGTKNERLIKRMQPLILKINDLERSIKNLSDDEIKAKTPEFKERLSRGEPLENIKSEAFAVVREASVRTLGMRHFDVQLIGGNVLHMGMISEMKTGEGKTLVATLPAYLNALSGKGVHIVTVNDYLAKRDAEWMGRIFTFLGLSVGVVYSGQEDDDKLNSYLADITYGQNNEFGFDYLRDNMKFRAQDMYQRGHNFAIVDEVDSILIDEARTPLIISGPAEDATDKYQSINKIIPHLKSGEHFEQDLRSKQPTLTETGILKSEELLNIENLYDPKHIEILHHVVQALRAHTTLERDVDYVVKDGEVIIVDEFTGRLMPGRRWSNGLHQAIEAKEGIPIKRENRTLASITFQNYFRMYNKLSGMTGTADTEAVEFKSIYNLDVVVIPPNRQMIRQDFTDMVFRTRKEKYDAVIEEIGEAHEKGQPILVGTISIEQSETLAKCLKTAGVQHNVLNAKHHEKEAEIVAQAGRFGALTISTNMAGRGTDIMLGGNPEFLAMKEAQTRDRSDPRYVEALKKYLNICAEEKEKVIASGGLYIIGTERHESRRIDNQLRGRSGRQGDPGMSRFYISLEDDLMKRFGGERMQTLMKRLGWDEGVAIDGRLISHSIESAQKKVEAFHFESRKHVTEYDDVMNKQRQVVYNLRSRMLHSEGIRETVLDMMDDMVEDAVISVCEERIKPMDWNLAQLAERISFICNSKYDLPSDIALETQTIFDVVRKDVRDSLAKKEVQVNDKLTQINTALQQRKLPFSIPASFEVIERDTVLETLDHFWNIHLQDMDHLREGIGLRGYGQKNPLHEYQKEGFLMFQQTMSTIKENIVRRLYYYELPEPQVLLAQLEAEMRRREAIEHQMKMVHASESGGQAQDDAASKSSSKNAIDERARMEALRKERRKQKKK